jgi:hypothetical protein
VSVIGDLQEGFFKALLPDIQMIKPDALSGAPGIQFGQVYRLTEHYLQVSTALQDMIKCRMAADDRFEGFIIAAG